MSGKERLSPPDPPPMAESHRPPPVCALWAAPLIVAVLGSTLVLLARAHHLALPPSQLELALTLLGALALGAGIAIGCWQHRAIARPLRHLAGARGTAPALDKPRELATLRAQVEVTAKAPWSALDPQPDRVSAAQRAMARELRRALQRNTLALHYQPQVSLATGEVVGVEALLRWPHPERGLIPPQSFIPMAEASGLIRPLGAWALAEAARAARRWRDQGLAITVSVNVSAAQLRRQDLAALVGRVLAATGLPPEALELELTESMFVDPRRLDMQRAVQTVAAMGVRLAIDDFGTGYSSLGYLKRLPVHKIKIDKSFVRELGTSELDAAIVRSIIGLARAFGKRVLAEGVEEVEQRRFLEREGCDEAQGFHFARPMPEAACTAFLLQQAGIVASCAPALAG